MNIPITVAIALFSVFIGAWFQRRHWLRSIAEEIRVRETADASALIDLIATTFDERIIAQRLFLGSIGDQERQKEARIEYREQLKSYFGKFNTIRGKLFFYFSYQTVVDFENELHNRIAENGLAIERLSRQYEKRGLLKSNKDLAREKARLNNDLSQISVLVFKKCRGLYELVSGHDFGSLRQINNWRDPENEFVSSLKLLRKVLNT
ncbi:hypothetical protein E0K89_021495 [Aquicoccus sp. SCR17]|nr:hypothetical protein [Carideicomes alvinocaridis]